jgi:hypothetical protein
MAGERTKTAALALVLAVFVLGVAIGGLGMYLARNKVMGATVQPSVDHSPTAVRARTVDRMTHELNLTADQQKELDTILAQTFAQYAAIHDQSTKMTAQTRNQGRDQIRAILTPEQLPKFEDVLRRIDEERKKRSSN